MPEMHDIFQHHGQAYIRAHKLLVNIRKAMSAIEYCRTAALGSHADTCDECGYTRN